MPRMFGLNTLGVLAASVAFYIIGYLWYAVIFKDSWMAAMGIPASANDEMNPSIYALGFIITLLQVVGIGLVLKWKNAVGLPAAAMTAAVLWLVFALPFAAYSYLYSAAPNTTLLMIDASHLLVGWVVSAVVLSFFK